MRRTSEYLNLTIADYEQKQISIHDKENNILI